MVPAIVRDRFELIRLAGSGGMGKVYEARDRVTAGIVALKVLEISTPEHVQRMQREAQALAQLKHPRIVQYVAHGTEHGRPFVAMEWVTGPTLAEQLRRGRLSVGDALKVTRHIGEALAFAHAQGIVHRDVKPSNVVLRDGELDGAMLIDFGVARLGAAAFGGNLSLTQTGVMVGTPSYMAPEQARGERHLDARADVFSLGCVLFRAIAGEAPFAGEDAVAVLAKVLLDDAPPLRDFVPDIPDAVEALLDKMLAKDPAERFPDAAAVVSAIDRLGTMTQSARATREGLSRAERRLTCVVLADTRAPVDVDSTQSSERVTQDVLSRARRLVTRFGARCELLASGSLALEIRAEEGGGQSAGDLARMGARSALALSAEFPNVVMALVTARVVVGSKSNADDVFDRAAKLLRRAASDPGHGPALDGITASLLDASFDVVQGDLPRLRAEKEPVLGGRTLLGRPTKFVGRVRELGMLEALFGESVSESVARVALVRGPVGIGKSRLREELVGRLAPPTRVLRSRCDPMTSGSANALLGDIIRQAADVRDGEPDSVRAEKLAARVAVSMSVQARARTTAFLGALAQVPTADPHPALAAARADPTRYADELRRAFEDWIGAECDIAPVALVLEDIHWADVPSIRVLGQVIRQLSTRPVFVVGFARPEFVSFGAFHRSEASLTQTITTDVSVVGSAELASAWDGIEVHSLDLASISKRAGESLVREALGAVDDAVVARLTLAAAGNPFFLEELVRAFAAGRGDALPESVLAMAQMRLEALDADARRVLRAAAVLGETFWRGAVASMTNEDPRAAQMWIETLAQAEILTSSSTSRFSGEAEFAFRHALLRDAAYAMLTPEDARTGHRLAASWLEGAGERDALRLAEHWERSDEPQRAIRHLIRAADQAVEACDFARALGAGRRARRLSPTNEELGNVLRVEAEAHRWRGETSASEEDARRALELLERGSAPWLDALRTAAYAASYQGRPNSLEELSAVLLDITPTPEAERSFVRAATGAAYSLSISGRGALRDRLMEHYEPIARRLARTDAQVALAMLQAVTARAASEGDHAALVRSGDEGAELARKIGDVRGELQYRVNVGYGLTSLGEFERACEILTAAHAEALRVGLPTVALIAEQNLGFARLNLGEIDRAREHEERVLALAREQNSPRLAAAAAACLALVAIAASRLQNGNATDLETAERHARDAVHVVDPKSPMGCHAAAVLADVLLAQGRDAEALVVAEGAGAVADVLAPGEVGHTRVRIALAEALRRAGRIDEARKHATDARALVLLRADKIEEPTTRRAFLERVPENARALALAEELKS